MRNFVVALISSLLFVIAVGGIVTYVVLSQLGIIPKSTEIPKEQKSQTQVPKLANPLVDYSTAKGIFGKNANKKSSSSVCSNGECKALIDSMDEKADPCKDFYQYACGGWIAKNTIPESEPRWNQMDIVNKQTNFQKMLKILQMKNDPKDPIPVNQARDFYAACMDTKLMETKGLKPLTDLLESYGGWPMTLKNWKESSFDWKKATADSLRLYNLDIMFVNIYVGLEKKNSSLNTIYITQTEEIRSQTRIQSLLGDVTTNKKPMFTKGINKKTKRIKRNENEADTDSNSSATNEDNVATDNNSPAENEEKVANIDSQPTSEDVAMAEVYRVYITGAAKAIRDSSNSKNKATDDQIKNDVNDLLRFENELQQIKTAIIENRNKSETGLAGVYTSMSISELQKWTDSSVEKPSAHAKIDWLNYLKRIFSLSSVTISKSDRVVVIEKDFLKQIIALLDKTPLRTIANFVHWSFVFALSSHTNKEMKQLRLKFNREYHGVVATDSSIDCVKLTNDLMGWAISYKLINEWNFDEKARNDTKVMIEKLKKAFKSLVNETTWMDPVSKVSAIEKVNHMIAKIAYPDWLNSSNPSVLESYYKEVPISRENHFSNIESIKTSLKARNLRSLRERVDRNEWSTTPTTVNAFYEPEYNAITLPAGILQIPFFGHGRAAAMNYGAIGTIIGHEISHGFDDQGRQTNKEGNAADWWVGSTQAKYLTSTQCFIEQYGNYTIPSGTHVNGVTAQGENIADNGGLRQAFRAYKLFVDENGAEPKLPGLENFTAEQLFFLSYANSWCGNITPEELENQIKVDMHTPNRFRVIGSLSNNEDFVREFKCPAGSAMNRKNKCIVW